MTLYDVVPPTLFFLSLGGITVIVARSALRMQQTAFSASLKTAATEVAAPSRLLKPTQKSVQVFGNRAAATRAALASSASATAGYAGSAAAGVRQQLGTWREAWAEQRATRQAEAAERQGEREALRAEQQAAKEAARAAKQEEKERRRSERELAKQQRQAELQATQVSVEPAEPEPAPSASPEEPTRVGPPSSAGIKTTLVTKARPKLPLLQRQPSPPQRSALEQAGDALDQSDFQQAEDILVEHIVKHTKDTKAYLLLGQVALRREAWGEAIEIYEQVLSWDEATPGAWAGLGTAAFSAGHYTKALPALQRAAEEDPTNSEVLEKLLTIARNMDNPALQDAIREKLEMRA